MRRSFGGGGGTGMGGGGGGGGMNMIRTVQRAVRAGVGGTPPEPFSPSAHTTTTTTIASANSRKAKSFNNKQPTSPNAALTLSSSSSSSANGSTSNTIDYGASSAFSSLINLPVSAASGAPEPAESEWEYVDGSEDEGVRVFYDDFVFGTVPSRDEVHHAVSALQQDKLLGFQLQALCVCACACACVRAHAHVKVYRVLGTSSYRPLPKGIDRDAADEVANAIGFERKVSSAESEIDWVEPSPLLSNSNMLQPRGSDRVYDAFHLLQTEPSVQRMVISLSSDKAVWDAVLNNEVVKELRGSIHQVDNVSGESSGEGSDGSNPVKDILSWVVSSAKAKIVQLIDGIAKLVNEVFQPPNEEKKGDTTSPLDEKLKTSLLLSILVLFVVVITRAQGA